MEEALLWNSGEEWSRLSKQRGVVAWSGGGSGEGCGNSNPGRWWRMKQPGRAGGCGASTWGGSHRPLQYGKPPPQISCERTVKVRVELPMPKY